MMMVILPLVVPFLMKMKVMLIIEMMALVCFFSMKLLFVSFLGGSFLNSDFYLDKSGSVLVFLTVWVTVLSLFTVDDYEKGDYLKFMIMLLMSVLIFLFMVTNMFYFFILYEVSLIPIIMIILGWGSQPERVEAGVMLLVYTLCFSLPFLALLITVSGTANVFKFHEIEGGGLLLDVSLPFTFVLVSVFLVKMPIFFLHFWLPKAHVEAPLPGSMILAGLLLKMGGYGLIRFSSFLKMNLVLTFFMSVAIIGMILVCWMCVTVPDVKMIIAYSSVSHMNIVIVGLLVISSYALTGGLMLMISHGLSSSAMFYLADLSYKRFHSRSLFIQKGLMVLQPMLTAGWFVVIMINMGLPPMISNMSEIYLSMSIVKVFYLFNFFIAMYLFFSGFYSIYLYSSLNHGNQNNMEQYYPTTMKEMMSVAFHVIPMVMMIFFTLFFS